jgi:hypothetical protein
MILGNVGSLDWIEFLHYFHESERRKPRLYARLAWWNNIKNIDYKRKNRNKRSNKILAKKYRKSWYGQSEKRVLELPKKI